MSSNKSKLNSKYTQGKYTLINPQKYIGNPIDIVFRSSWELGFCRYLDNNDNVKLWGCEQPVITYFDLKGTSHRYFPDFYFEILNNNDSMDYKKVIVEIKPSNELEPPIKPKNETGKALENYEYALRTFIKNRAKWSYAVDYAQKYGMEFVIITEQRLIKEGIISPKTNYKKSRKK